jgi:hypothetical protein
MADYYTPAGVLVLILDIWAIINILNSSQGTGTKVLWILIILFLPLVGFVVWFLAGPRENKI